MAAVRLEEPSRGVLPRLIITAIKRNVLKNCAAGTLENITG
jgi:hypothetical protein